MSSRISTRDELLSNAFHLVGNCWRVVEAQNKISTAKLTDNTPEQHTLELLIEQTKPVIPADAQHLNYLLSTPFRYGAPYPRGSRFRRVGLTDGVFYASDHPHTAIAELCFHRLLFFRESPATKWPSDAGEYTAFAVDYSANSIDLTIAPFIERAPLWMHVTEYEPCQTIAEIARSVDVDLIKYASVRDPSHRKNIAILRPRAFTVTEPTLRQTWRLLLNGSGARALCEMPSAAIDFGRETFQADPRIASMQWLR
jgi:RES domain